MCMSLYACAHVNDCKCAHVCIYVHACGQISVHTHARVVMPMFVYRRGCARVRKGKRSFSGKRVKSKAPSRALGVLGLRLLIVVGVGRM